MSFSSRNHVSLFLSILVLAVLGAATALATDFPTRKVVVIGTATIKVAPDEMNWTVQISINDSTLEKAKARHDQSLADALKFIKYVGGAASQDLQTSGVVFAQQTDFPENADRSQPFSCSTTITFTLTDFNKYGQLCDGLAKLDGIQVPSVAYAFSQAEATQRQALTQALLKAHDKANDLAVAAGCYIDKPLEIDEGTGNGMGPRVMTAAPGYAGGTPAPVSGQLEITATVTVTYDLFYR
jgi:uncharacterized protein YggE